MANILYQNGLTIGTDEIDIPPSSLPDFSSCYLFAFPKAGSVLVNQIVRALMKEIGVPVVDVSQHAFDKGIRLQNAICDIEKIYKEFGYCYSGFRGFPPFFSGVLTGTQQKKILIVRDPRDMVVSLYYSMKYSHKLDEIGTLSFNSEMRSRKRETIQSIDDYCLFNSYTFNHALRGYFGIINDPATRILRYEDFIYDKMSLVSSICEWFSIDLSHDRKKEIAAMFDDIPAEEQPLKHVRQVHPGDHRRKLNPQTIQVLNAVFSKFMTMFGYSA